MSHSHHEKGHSHTHNHAQTSNKKALTLSFVLIAGYMFVEFIGGMLTNSLALLSDAGHMLSDAVALGLSLTAVIFGERAASAEKTYGYKRFEIIAALLNGIALVVLSSYILYEAIVRLSSPPQVIGKGLFIIAIIGLMVNIIVAWILSRGNSKENLNIKSAYLHVLGDLLGSVGAIIAAVLILLFGWNIADPIASMIVALLVLYSGWHILKESVNVLMESKPSDIDSTDLIKVLKNISGVEDVHDLHIWMITQEFPALTVHLRVLEDVNRDVILEAAYEAIIMHTKITHITIQIEGRDLKYHHDICQSCDHK